MFALAVAAAFATAGISTALAPGPVGEVLTATGLSESRAAHAARLIGCWEVALAGLVLSYPRLGLTLVLTSLVAYSMTAIVGRAHELTCGCLLPGSRASLGNYTVARNSVLGGFAVVGMTGGGISGLTGAAVAGAGCLFLAVVLLDELAGVLARPGWWGAR